MDFGFTEDQEMFRDTAKKFFANECPVSVVRDILTKDHGYSGDLWKKIAELGLLGLLIDEEYGGLGGSFLDLAPLLEEMGRAIFPSPFLPTVVMGGTLISGGANSDVKEKLLPAIVAGDAIVSLGVGERGEEWAETEIKTMAEKDGDGYVIEGTKLFVPFADASDHIICCAKDSSASGSGTTLFLVDGKDKMIQSTSIPSFSIDKYYRVNFDRVKVSQENIIGTPGKGWEAIEDVRQKVVAARCLEMVGGLQRVLDMTVQYVSEREQFGKPIGSLQTIQNYCAEIAIDVETSKYITYQAAWKVSNNMPCRAEVSMAKAWCGDAFQRATTVALQSHGAMGFTEEYDLHFYYKQAKVLQLMYGGSTYHRKLVADEMGL